MHTKEEIEGFTRRHRENTVRKRVNARFYEHEWRRK